MELESKLKTLDELTALRAQWAAEGKISSHVDRTFPLAQTADALKVLAGRKAMGKVILHP